MHLIASYRAGLRKDVSVEEHRLELRKRRVNAPIALARRVARQVFQCCRRQIAYGADRAILLSDVSLRSMALTYGCNPVLVDHSVAWVRQLIRDRGLVL